MGGVGYDKSFPSYTWIPERNGEFDENNGWIFFRSKYHKSDLVFLKFRRAVLTELESKLNKMLDEFKDYYYKYFKSVSLKMMNQSDQCSI